MDMARIMALLVSVVLLSYSASATLSDCEQKRNEALGITGNDSIAKPMPGRFVPSCTDDGYYNSVQCHGSTGYCWCVEIVKGIKIPNTEVRSETPRCPRTILSECQRRLLAARVSGRMGAQQFRCETDGSYKPLQRIGSVCYCVDDRGRKIQGSDTPVHQCTNLDCVSKFKTCQKERHEILRTKHQLGRFVPQCKEDGSYTETQCHEMYCWCVNPVTGEKRANTTKSILDGVNPVCSTNQQTAKLSECQRRLSAARASGRMGAQHFQCETDGSYKPVQRIGSVCYCVDDEGRKIQGSDTPVHQCADLDCISKFKKCQKERHQGLEILRTKRLLGKFVPRCKGDGSYTETQCHEMYCWCVNPATGEKTADTTKSILDEVKPVCSLNQETAMLSECQRKHLAAKASGRMGAQHFQCETDGSYKPVQRIGSVCYCVDDEGRKIQGSDTPVHQCANLDCISKFKKCQKERHQGLEILRIKHLLGKFVPRCKGDGSYTETQCHEMYCWCVNPATGEKISDTTKSILDGVKPVCSANQQTECQRQKEKSQELKSRNPPPLGVFEPECEDNGKFVQKQCRENSCYCVNVETGQQTGLTVVRKDKATLTC